MSDHALAVMFFAGLIFQVGCIFGVPKDTRPWNAARVGSLVGGVVLLAAAAWLAVDAL